jgi:Rad/Gem-related GTP binding protein 1
MLSIEANSSISLCRHSNHSNLSGVSPGERSPFEGSCCGSSYNNVSSDASVEEITKYRVVLLGDAGVGKTALVSQFMTSEYMNTYDASLGKTT